MTLPQFGRAQVFGPGFQPGTYVLTNSRSQLLQGQIKLRNNGLLAVKDEAGKVQQLNADQVSAFRLGSRKYVSVGGFHVVGGLIGYNIKSDFAEQLDSGRVMLFRYQYDPSGGANGGIIRTAYLLSSPSGLDVVAAQAPFYSNWSPQFRDAVQPFLLSRPDLVIMLNEKHINEKNLPAVVRAINANAPFDPAAVLTTK